MARSKNEGGWEKLVGLCRVDGQREQREEALATGFTPVAACDALFSSYVVRSFRKTFAFPCARRRHRHASFAGNRFPCVKSADEFPASFPPPDPLRAFVFDGPAHLSICERGFYKMVHFIGMRNISIHHVTTGGGWLA